MTPHPNPARQTLRRVALALCLSALAPVALAQHDHHAPTVDAASQGVLASGEGVVKKIDAGKNRITVAHEPIAKLSWPAMTMPFKVRDPALLRDLKVGERIGFDLEDEGTISAIRR
ncbi:MAG: copper-binding protein [Azoarcus sp.]|jgi:Cu/Ag efflux protein CusF|nr:copper-binding protein [Azoarcus sp.]